MIRSMMGRKKGVEYEVRCNQGTPKVFVDGVMVGSVKDGICKWTDNLYDKDVTITLEGVKIHSTSIQRSRTIGYEIDGDFIGWQGQYASFYGYKETHRYRFLSGYTVDTYKNTAVTNKTMRKGTAKITMNYSRKLITSELQDLESISYKDNGEDSTPGTWDGSIDISEDSVTVNYGTQGAWDILISVPSEFNSFTATFHAKRF